MSGEANFHHKKRTRHLRSLAVQYNGNIYNIPIDYIKNLMVTKVHGWTDCWMLIHVVIAHRRDCCTFSFRGLKKAQLIGVGVGLSPFIGCRTNQEVSIKHNLIYT